MHGSLVVIVCDTMGLVDIVNYKRSADSRDEHASVTPIFKDILTVSIDHSIFCWDGVVNMAGLNIITTNYNICDGCCVMKYVCMPLDY